MSASSMFNNVLRMGLSLSLMDRDLFVKKVSEFLEQYRNDPEQMEKVAAGLYKYLEDVKERMDMKDVMSGAVNNVISNTELPTADDIHDLKKAIEKLTEEIRKQKEEQGNV